MEAAIAGLGVFGVVFLFIIGLLYTILPFIIMIRVGNIVKELRKLNHEFNKFYRWIYDKEQPNT